MIRRLGTERRLLQDTTDALRIRERLTDLAGREVIVRPSLAGLARKRRSMVFTLVHVHTVVEDTTATPTLPLAKATGEGENQAQLPSVFALHQNYPNPLNPSTRVDYDLPEPANVSLVVYDETLTPISPAPASLPEPSFSSQVCADTRVVDEHEMYVVWEALNHSLLEGE